MSDTSKVVVPGAIAAALTVGAVQFAPGDDLTVGLLSAALTTTNSVNRSAKADRAEALPAIGQTKIISLHYSVFANTSFLLRIPAAAPAPAETVRNTTGTAASSSQPVIKSGAIKPQDTKRPIACEPSVSILTEIAKSLQPGRCVT
ncbi:conserved exported hypothetical protein [Bradyrhizobium sp. STM 3843]|uniref:hypothetical protein n=1 Tax=Bradyrhizobium sp. STM 3843 TaxID=551947 RepID=UPI000240AFCA|nr:hypothetical protein [Bradyrhizobium sp. STM 3843]CCE06417.1 conserved exported hypothetical protein [Bradyrhizobium sp. STM 3843]